MTNNTTIKTYTKDEADAIGKAFVTASNTYGKTAEFLRYVGTNGALELLELALLPALRITDKAKRKRTLDAWKVQAHRIKNAAETQRLTFKIEGSIALVQWADIKKKEVKPTQAVAAAGDDDSNADPGDETGVGGLTLPAAPFATKRDTALFITTYLKLAGLEANLLAQVEAVLNG